MVKYPSFSFTIFLDLGELVFENFIISENNVISLELAKVLRKKKNLRTLLETAKTFLLVGLLK
jgi:hypothetical protein